MSSGLLLAVVAGGAAISGANASRATMAGSFGVFNALEAEEGAALAAAPLKPSRRSVGDVIVPKRTGQPTSVRLVYFTATRVKNKPKQITVKWKTGGEPDTLGFRLYRQVGKVKTKVGSLIVSKGGGLGAAYSRTDKLPKHVAKACYALDVVTTQGAAAPLGSVCMKK